MTNRVWPRDATRTSGFVALTDKWARLYFLSFNILMVLIILNIFLAFVIEAFVLQLELEHLEFEDVLMNKLERELQRSPALRGEYERTAIKKTRKMHALLAHLFGEGDNTPASPPPGAAGAPGVGPALAPANSSSV